MNPPEIQRAIIALRESLPRAGLVSAILFGSAARDQASDGSDIDLLLVPRDGRGGSRALQRIREIEDRLKVRCSVMVSRSTNLADLERQLVESIVRQGVPLVGPMPSVSTVQLDLEPVRLLGLNLAGLDQRDKVRLERKLFGYVTSRRHGRRSYRSRSIGLVRERGGRRIGRTLILVPEAAVPDLDEVLRSYPGARRILVPAWVQRP